MAVIHKLRKPVDALQALRSRKRVLVFGVFLALGVAGVLAFLLVGCRVGTNPLSSPPPTPAVQPLQVSHLQNMVSAAVTISSFAQSSQVRA